MTQNSELQTLCPLHETKVSLACLYRGCPQALLCIKCYRDHPRDHESEIKYLTEMIENNNWIEVIERQKDLELSQIEGLHQQKKQIIMENERLLNEFVESIITTLEAQKQIWLKDFNGLISFSDQQEIELDGSLKLLASLDFEGDIIERINKVKNFQESVLPSTRKLIDTLQSHLGKWKVDKKKIDGIKVELDDIIQKLNPKNFVGHEPLKSIRIYEEQVTLQGEDKVLKNNMSCMVESLNRKIGDLIKWNIKLKMQLNQVIEIKGPVETEYEKEVSLLKKIEDSTIIQAKDFAKLKEWIPKPLPSSVTVLKLVYRASRDGWSAQNFHTKCDGITPTISVIKSKEYGRIFGGYTTKSWGLDSGYTEDQEAFIFSLTHGKKYSCKNPSQAIFTRPGFMVVFGYGSDICLEDNCNTEQKTTHCNFPYSYECSRFPKSNPDSQAHLAGNKYFKVEELEVYQILYL